MNHQEKRRLQREQEKKQLRVQGNQESGATIKYICTQCKIEEDIPESVVEYFDVMDDGDTSVPPRFTCNNCHGDMVPRKYEGVHGIQYEYEADT